MDSCQLGGKTVRIHSKVLVYIGIFCDVLCQFHRFTLGPLGSCSSKESTVGHNQLVTTRSIVYRATAEPSDQHWR